MPKFIGSEEVEDVKVSGEHTPRGSDILRVVFKGGRQELIPAVMFEAIATQEAVDDTKLRDARVLAIAKEVIEVFAEYDIKFNEIESLQQVIKSTQEENYVRAQNVLWGTPEKRWLDMWRVLAKAGVKPIGADEAVEN